MQTTPPNLKSRQSLLSGSVKFNNTQYRLASVNRSQPAQRCWPQVASGSAAKTANVPLETPLPPGHHHTDNRQAPSNSRRWVSYIAKSSPAQRRCRRALPSRVSSNIRRGSLGRNAISGSPPFISAQQKGPHLRPCILRITQREPQAAYGHE